MNEEQYRRVEHLSQLESHLEEMRFSSLTFFAGLLLFGGLAYVATENLWLGLLVGWLVQFASLLCVQIRKTMVRLEFDRVLHEFDGDIDVARAHLKSAREIRNVKRKIWRI